MTPAWRDRVPPGSWDAVVVGAGPNGLAAAITLARAGRRVLVLEAASQPGGGLRSAELTDPGFVHDLCASVLGLGRLSEFLRSLPLERFGVRWSTPPLAVAHPFEDGSAAVMEASVEATAQRLGRDGRHWKAAFSPFTDAWESFAAEVLAPPHVPRHPLLLARFGLDALRSASGFAARFAGEPAKALFAGLAAHSCLPLDSVGSASFGLVLGAPGHKSGWPVVAGGSQRLADALVMHLVFLGGTIVTQASVGRLEDLPPARAVLLDVTPRQLLAMAGERLPASYRQRLEGYRLGPGVFKIDYALDAPIPWRATDCSRTATVHLGASLREMLGSEGAVASGRVSDRPYVIVVQPTVCDATRAPFSKHTAWAYAHVPNGWIHDVGPAIEAQIERFAPGFGGVVRARSVWNPARLQADNPNQAGGDIGGGSADLLQILARPVLALDPYATPLPGVTLCSSSTPPGPGAHGLCGYFAARSALQRGA